ncbi:NmrA-like family protein-like protein [Stachybotrys elegans]|uniref:NmrA-like family protein-like protein n=1 Tax=Stachybotrys elegans TaxID=80388 RepID=A0A8K0SHY9_9HYPO|nr:NmrA-like family protein-like protein [Stachybotrys elegans]
MSKLITVVGATGKQGGSVINALLGNPEYKLRAITRNTESDAAKSLSQKGVEVVKADANDPSSLESAFAGSHAIFAVSNFFDAFPAEGYEVAMDIETKHGINLANAAAKTPTLQHYIWSTLPDTVQASGGKHFVSYYVSKAKVDEHIKSIPDLLEKTTFLWVTAYASNFLYPFHNPIPVPSMGYGPQKHLHVMPVPSTTLWPLAGDVSVNTGLYVKAILSQPQLTLPGKYVRLATEFMSGADVLSLWDSTHGTETAYIEVTLETYDKLWPRWGEVLGGSFVYWRDLGPKAFDREGLVTNDHLKIEGLVGTEEAFRKQ